MLIVLIKDKLDKENKLGLFPDILKSILRAYIDLFMKGVNTKYYQDYVPTDFLVKV
jgi:hypothetical protein